MSPDKNNDSYYLNQMVFEAEEALRFFQEIDNSESNLIQSPLYQKGISKSLEQMGEMLSHGRLSEELKARYDFIDWRGIKGYRNMGVHEYGQIDWSEVSALLRNELRQTVDDLLFILHEESKNQEE